MDDLLSEFLTETAESLSVLDVELIKLEQTPDDPDLLSSIFRLVHTIKGTCGFLGLPRLESVAHASENVLGKVRDGAIQVTPVAISTVLESLDQIKWILSELEANEAEPAGDDAELISRLNAIADGAVVEAAAPAAADEFDAEPAMDAEAEAEAEAEVVAEAAVEIEPAVEEAPAVEEVVALPEPVAEAIAPAPTGKAKKQAPADAAEKSTKESSVANQTIRVSVDLLENLMTLVSELVLTRNQLLQMVRNQTDSEFNVPLQRLSHVTSELQENVMKTRMQPIGNAWAKLPRIIRDLAVELDKKIELEMIGADTELDRQVLELIKDPLTHMVRNSADHGLETPAERAAAGKNETGTVVLRAYHEGGHIILQITDDGRGLNLERIKQKAVANGLATETELEAMTDQQIQQFIFKAGFSTAQQVTSVSGRGVGMDVVRTNIEKIGGTIELSSTQGKGSRFTIKIPLTLAIVSALIVEAGGERFAMPQLSVVELVRVSAKSDHKIETINGAPVLRLRNRILPLISLRNLLRLNNANDDEPHGEDAKADNGTAILHGSTEHFIVVTKVGTYDFGIVVDRVFDTEEIVVKPVAPILRNISMFSGNTILGDGSVIMILDPNGIAGATGEMAPDAAAEANARVAAHGSEENVTMLVFKAGDDTPKAVPLALIARLEEIEAHKIEWSSGKPMVQYRGKLMPIVAMSDDYQIKREGMQAVLVFSDQDHSMGLAVDEIVDIVEDRMNVELSADRAGYVGSAVVAGKATDVIDAGYFLGRAFANWFSANHRLGDDAEVTSNNLLLVDDSPFFRNVLTPLLSAAGYAVTSVESAKDALTLCEQGRMFDAIISDIEMPEMSGIELAEVIRDSAQWRDTPIIALSSHSNPRDIDRARAAGFSDYVAKTDREGLLQTLSETIVQLRGAA
ncbi:MAG: chemotaxis protein CheW [Alphaproteobacteria bacterium]